MKITSEIVEGLELNSIEALAAMAQFEGIYQTKVDAAKEFCTATYRKFKKGKKKSPTIAPDTSKGKLPTNSTTLENL